MKENCVDLELAKKLKDNKFIQLNILFSYYNEWASLPILISTKKAISLYKKNKDVDPWIAASPTSNELLEMLPTNLGISEIRIEYCLETTTWMVGYIKDKEEFSFYFENQKLSNALAELWLYLKEKGLLNEMV